MNVAIVGCGPSGMLAAHAAWSLGHTPYIFTDRIKPSVLTGAMYLHEEIPGLTSELPDRQIRIVKLGTAEGYARKVYGDPNHPVSWDHFEEGPSPMWSLRDAYQKAWHKYNDLIGLKEITTTGLRGLTKKYKVVICTAPKPAFCLCPDEHIFSAQPVWIRSRSLSTRSMGARMVYSGLDRDPWYRLSQIDGIISHEYATKPPFNGHSPGRKPISNNCDCWPSVHWAGRFGAWTKGVLTHHVYQGVHDALYQMQ